MQSSILPFGMRTRSLADQGISVVVFGVITEPVLAFIFDPAIAHVSDANDRSDAVGDVICFTHRLANDVDRFAGESVYRVLKSTNRAFKLSRGQTSMGSLRRCCY